MNLARLTQKKQQLDRFRPLPPALVKNLDDWFRVELTYTSNAIEGNTLTRQETALVVEKGVTIGGKALAEHLEATNHAKAIDWIHAQIARAPSPSAVQIVERDILRIHEIILAGIQDEYAGRYRDIQVRIAGSEVILPNPRKVPALMEEFARWLQTGTSSPALHPVELAAEAHYRLVSIHPFVDGNGRTARLLMNFILLMSSYPPAIIRKEDRLAYLASLEKRQLGGESASASDDYRTLIAEAVDRSLDIYLQALEK